MVEAGRGESVNKETDNGVAASYSQSPQVSQASSFVMPLKSMFVGDFGGSRGSDEPPNTPVENSCIPSLFVEYKRRK